MLEVTIALAVFMVLSAGIFAVWRHSSNSAMHLLARQNAFENARGAMDALLMNIQMAKTIVLVTDRYDNLESLTLTERNPQGFLHNYIFQFDVNAAPGTTQHQRLRFGMQEFASNLAAIIITIGGNYQRMYITIITGCDYPIILYGSGDIRYKDVTVVRRN